MNAFRDVLGHGANAADALFLGGAVGKTRRRNAFNDEFDAGNYDKAASLALRAGEPAYAQYAQQRGAAQATAQRDSEAEERRLFSGLTFGLSEISDPEMRAAAFEAMKPGLSQRYGLSDDDYAQVPIGNVDALRLFGQQMISPQDQATNQQERFSNQTERIEAQETVRSNRADERNRGRQLDIAQQGANLNERKFQQGVREFEATQGQQVDEQQRAAVQMGDALANRGQRVETIIEAIDDAASKVGRFSTGFIFGNAFSRTVLQPSIDLDSSIDTVVANLGFEEMNRLRELAAASGNRGTGLGQITEREIKFLQSVEDSLRQAQSKEELEKALQNARSSILQSWQRVVDVYERDFGATYAGPGSGVSTTASGGSGDLTPDEQQELEQLRREFGQ